MVELLREGETKPTVTDVLTKIVASALVRHRAGQRALRRREAPSLPAANVGIAVAAPSGLVVPVIRDAERKSVQQIAADRADIVVARARREAPAAPISRAGRSRSRTSGCTASSSSSPSSTRRRSRSSRSARSRSARSSIDGELVDRPDDDDDAHVRPPRDRRLRGRRVPARRQGVRRGASAGALESPSMVIRRGGRQDVRFLRDMLHHAYYWRERNPGDGPGPAARYVKGWGRPGDTVLIAVDDAFPGRRRVVPPVPPRPAGLRVRRRGDAGARDRRRAEPARARDRRGAPRGALRARARRRLPRTEPQRRARATPRSSPSTRSTASLVVGERRLQRDHAARAVTPRR